MILVKVTLISIYSAYSQRVHINGWRNVCREQPIALNKEEVGVAKIYI